MDRLQLGSLFKRTQAEDLGNQAAFGAALVLSPVGGIAPDGDLPSCFEGTSLWGNTSWWDMLSRALARSLGSQVQSLAVFRGWSQDQVLMNLEGLMTGCRGPHKPPNIPKHRLPLDTSSETQAPRGNVVMGTRRQPWGSSRNAREGTTLLFISL